MSCAHEVRFAQTAVHELIGHGTGKLLTETAPGQFNFDHTNPPISPITGDPISTWYKPGETWNSVFGKLAPTVEECRAYLIADYLADNRDVLGMFGYDHNSTPTADDCRRTLNDSSITDLQLINLNSYVLLIPANWSGRPPGTPEFRAVRYDLGR
jgi:hypothetical protein